MTLLFADSPQRSPIGLAVPARFPPTDPGLGGQVSTFGGDATYPAGALFVTNPAQFHELWQAAQMRRAVDESHRLLAGAYEECQALALPKALGLAPTDVQATFTCLKQSFPNLLDLVATLEGGCYRAALRPDRAIPTFKLLLVGPPGVGKTVAVEAIKNTLKLPCFRISVNAQSAAFEIKGSGRHWANSSPGMIARCFSQSPQANPIFLLDEIDKGPEGQYQFSRAADALLELIEEETAGRFRDECLQVEIDTHRALWIATANDIRPVPEALRSRFQVIEVAPPTPCQMRGIIRNIYTSLISAESGNFVEELPDAICRLLLTRTPRAARLSLNDALNAAARRTINCGDTVSRPIQLLPTDLPACTESAPHRIGFLP